MIKIIIFVLATYIVFVILRHLCCYYEYLKCKRNNRIMSLNEAILKIKSDVGIIVVNDSHDGHGKIWWYPKASYKSKRGEVYQEGYLCSRFCLFSRKKLYSLAKEYNGKVLFDRTTVFVNLAKS